MKKIIIMIILVFGGLVSVPVIAQTATPTEEELTPTESTSAEATADEEELDEEVNQLKEKVAETVSKLNEGNEKAIAGAIASIEGDELTVSTEEDETLVSLDSTLTKYYQIQGTTTQEIEKEDIEEGDYVFVAGPEIDGEVTANAVYKDISFMILSGKITAVDSDNYTVTMISLDKTAYTLDIQTDTTQSMLDIQSLEVESTGFSKLKEGDSIHVVVRSNFENPDAKRFDAERLLIIPNEYFIQ